MKNKWKHSTHIGTRLLQSTVLLACTGLLYLQVSGFSTAASVTSAAPGPEALESKAIREETFSPIEGSLPVDGDYESAMQQVLNTRPLYSTEKEEAKSSHDALPLKAMTWENLDQMLTGMTETYEGTWSIYVKDLTTEETISLREAPMEAASLIKLYIMGAVLEQIQLGDLEDSETIDELLHEMITVSDNEASNELVRYLSPNHEHREGMAVVNDFIQSHGYSNTLQSNGLADTNLWYSSDVNYTSAGDCGRLLEEIYNGKLVSHLASRRMENLLMEQDIEYKIPDALPDDIVSASKTGEVTGTENDTAIVYSKGGDFILCIMSTGWSSQEQAIGQIHQITKTVCDYFNPETPSDVKVQEIPESEGE